MHIVKVRASISTRNETHVEVPVATAESCLLKVTLRVFRQVLLVVGALLSGALAATPQSARQEVTEEAIDRALSDKRYLLRQLKCATGEAPCDPVGRRLKSK